MKKYSIIGDELSMLIRIFVQFLNADIRNVLYWLICAIKHLKFKYIIFRIS
jgi:hypothetical protein